MVLLTGCGAAEVLWIASEIVVGSLPRTEAECLEHTYVRRSTDPAARVAAIEKAAEECEQQRRKEEEDKSNDDQ